VTDVGALTQEMTLLHHRAEAQMQHRANMMRIDRGWAAMQAGLQATADMLRQGAGRFELEWPDAAGVGYVKRLHRSATTVQAWHDALASVDMGQTLTTLTGEIDVTFRLITQLKKTFDQLVQHLAAMPYGPFADPAVAAQMEKHVGAILERLRQLVHEARELLLRLDQTFLDAARRVAGAPDGTPWDGPTAVDAGTTGAAGQITAAPGGPGAGDPTLSAPAGSPGGAGPGGAASDVAMSPNPGTAPAAAGGAAAIAQSGRPAGDGIAPAGTLSPVGLGATPPGGAGAPGLAGLPAPTPVTGLSAIGAPLTSSLPTAASFTAPTLPPLLPPGVPGAGVPGALGLAGSGHLRAGGSGGVHVPKPVAGTASTAIARAGAPIGTSSAPVSPPPPAPPTVEVGTPAGAGGGATRPPMAMMPPMAGGAGAGGGPPKAGTADDASGGHRSRPLRAVPGVPFRLRDRTGTLDGATFLGTGRRPATAPPERHADGVTAQPLDDELWKVD